MKRSSAASRLYVPRASPLRRSRIQGKRTRSLKLDLNPTPRAEVRPNFILPFTDLIPPDTLGLPENPNPCNAERIAHLWVFRACRNEKGAPDCLAREDGTSVARKAVAWSRNNKSARNFPLNIDRVGGPVIGTCVA